MLGYSKKELRERFSCENCIYVSYNKKHFSCLLRVGIEDNSLSRKKFTFCNRHIAKKTIKFKCKKTKSKNRFFLNKEILRISFPFKQVSINDYS